MIPDIDYSESGKPYCWIRIHTTKAARDKAYGNVENVAWLTEPSDGLGGTEQAQKGKGRKVVGSSVDLVRLEPVKRFESDNPFSETRSCLVTDSPCVEVVLKHVL